MLVMTTKLTKRKAITWILVIGFLLCGVIMLKAQLGGEESAVAANAVNPEKIKTEEDRVALLESYGWKVSAEPLEFMEVQIPEEFDEAYTKYNEIQKAQGMNLTEYAGKRVMKYSYAVENHPSGEDGVVATLLIYKNRLIGGDVASAKMDGFMQGLARPEEPAQKTEQKTEQKKDGA